MSIVVSAKSGRRADDEALVQPLEGARLSDRLATRIAVQIGDGNLRVGDKLPTELMLAEAHGVSRTVVREAMHQLKSQGLVRSRQGLGVFVTAPPAHRPIAFDAKLLESMDAVVQMVELRSVMEGEMAALAARRATRRQLAQIQAALAAIDAATDRDELAVDEDLAFHRAIGEATGNPQFVRLLHIMEAYLRDAMTVTKGYESMRADFMEQVRGEHRAIAAAIAAGDEQAARRAAIDHHVHGEDRLVISGVIKRRQARGRGDPGRSDGRSRRRTAAIA